MELLVGQQMELTQRLLSICSNLPASYPVCLTAGDLLCLLRALAETAPAKRPKETDEGKTQPSATKFEREFGSVELPRIRQFHLRLPSGEAERRIREFLADQPDGSRIVAIAQATGLDNTTVSNVLERGGFERWPIGSKLWRVRASNAPPLSRSDSEP